MNSEELQPFFPTLASLEQHGYTVTFLVRKAEDFRLCLQGQYELVLEFLLQAQFYPGLTLSCPVLL